MRDNSQGPRKLLLGAAIVGSFIIYSLAHNAASAVTAAPNTANGGTSSSGTSSPTSTSSSDATPSGTATNGSSSSNSSTTSGTTYKNGTYTGSVADAQWGNVQVQVTVKGGQISDVQFLQYPNERERSVEINQYADPILIQEAIQGQTAQVDFVSGASDTSYAFIQSLTDALSQAQ